MRKNELLVSAAGEEMEAVPGCDSEEEDADEVVGELDSSDTLCLWRKTVGSCATSLGAFSFLDSRTSFACS